MKVKIQNFQSIKSAELDFSGFVVVTGESNLGKSAAFRALKGAFFGYPGDHYVRHGESSCVVEVDDSFTVRWERVHKDRRQPGRQTQLSVNGTVHQKYGNDHEPMTKGLGFRTVETNAGDYLPQFAFQHDEPFLLMSSPGTVAEVFKMLGRVDVVTEAQRLARKDFRAVEARRKIRETDREAAWENLCIMGGLPLVEQAHEQTVKDYEGTRETTDRLAGLTQDLSRVQALVPVSLSSPPDLGPLGREIALHGQVERANELAPTQLPSLPDLPDLAAQAHLLAKVERASALQGAGPPAPPPSLFDLDHWQDPLTKLERLIELSTPDPALGSLQKAIETNEKRLKEREAELDACPTCERAF